MWTMSPPHEDVCQWEDQGVKSLFIKCGKDVCCSAAVCDICCDVFYRTIQCQVCFVARCLAVCCLQYLCPLRLCNYYKNEQLLPAIYNSPWQIFSSKMAFVLWSSSLCPSCLTSGVKCLCYLAPQHVWSVGSWIWGRQYRILCRRGTAQLGKTPKVRAQDTCEPWGRWRGKSRGSLCPFLSLEQLCLNFALCPSQLLKEGKVVLNSSSSSQRCAGST